MVEETTAASQSLAREAEDLAALIGRFRFTEHEEATAPAASRTPANTRTTRPAPASVRKAGVRPATRGNLALRQAPEAIGWEEF